MGSRDFFKLGDFNVICDSCGFKFKGSELRKRWDGAMVCKQDWEPRPLQEFIKGIKEDQATPFSRPEVPIQYTTGYKQALAGATSITSASLGNDGRVIVDVIEQIYGTTQGAVTITIASSIVTGNVVIVKGVHNSGVVVNIVNNGTGTLIQEA